MLQMLFSGVLAHLADICSLCEFCSRRFLSHRRRRVLRRRGLGGPRCSVTVVDIHTVEKQQQTFDPKSALCFVVRLLVSDLSCRHDECWQRQWLRAAEEGAPAPLVDDRVHGVGRGPAPLRVQGCRSRNERRFTKPAGEDAVFFELYDDGRVAATLSGWAAGATGTGTTAHRGAPRRHFCTHTDSRCSCAAVGGSASGRYEDHRHLVSFEAGYRCAQDHFPGQHPSARRASCAAQLVEQLVDVPVLFHHEGGWHGSGTVLGRRWLPMVPVFWARPKGELLVEEGRFVVVVTFFRRDLWRFPCFFGNVSLSPRNQQHFFWEEGGKVTFFQ